MKRVTVLITYVFAVLISLFAIRAASAVEAVDVKSDVKVLDLSAVAERHDGEGDRLQVSTAPGPDGIVRRIEVRARQKTPIPGWFVFALANNTDSQMDRYLVVPHFRMAGSGLLKPDLGAQRVFAISTSQGFAPERISDAEADVFQVTLDPGNVVTFVGEMSDPSLPGLFLWEPQAYKDYVNSYTFYRGIILGIAGLLALFLVILFVVKGAAMFPAAALLAWSVLAYLAIDFGFMGRLFDISTASEPVWRAVAEVVFSASILILLFTYLTLHRWHVRYLHATGIWLIFLIVVLGVALFDPSLGAGIARLSMVVTAVAGFAVILYLSFTGFDRAIMLIPTWILLLLWLLASGAAVAGLLDNDLVQPALNGGLVLLVLLFCFTIMQHAFSGGILAQGIVSDSERRALAIIGSGDMVWDWDVPRDRIHTSKEAEQLLGLKNGSLDGHARDWLEHLHPQDRDRFSAMLDAIIEQRRGRINQDFRLRAEDGHYRWFKLRVRPVVGTDGEVVRCVGTLLDITDQRTTEERMLHDAVHDNLTGLANRELLQDRLGAAMIRAQAEGTAKPSVLLLDIDDFRVINDKYGLSIGDSILLTVARRLSRLLKPQDSIARFYGDQFAIVLISEQQPERIAVFADSVRKVLKEPIVFGDKELTLSVSIGIAIHDMQQHKSANDVLNDSELALYHAKRMGGDRIEPFRPSLRQQGRGRGPLDKDLEAALEQNEFDVVFQPIVDLQSREIKGFEALARWNHPQRGPVPPADFIPAAERTGLIVPLGLFVMEQAARQLSQWQQKLKEMSGLFMSVNVSSEQLLNHDLINDVKTILSRSNVNPGTLKLELTESLVMENPEYASQMLDKLRDLGAGLSLDDFGTGYSSLAYLQHFPFDTLKIDKSFVGHDEGAAPVILRSIVHLAQELELNLIAEGVESEEAASQLDAMGCPLGQGFLFGKPMVAADAAQLLAVQAEQIIQLREQARQRRIEAERQEAARKAEEERRIREAQRRKEAEKLERMQEKARQIAAEKLPEARLPEARPPAPSAAAVAAGATAQRAEQTEEGKAVANSLQSPDSAPRAKDETPEAQDKSGDVSLEAQLAASLAMDLVDGPNTGPNTGLDVEPGSADIKSKEEPGQEKSKPSESAKTKASPEDQRVARAETKQQQSSDMPAAEADDMLAGLDDALEGAIGAAALEAVADLNKDGSVGSKKEEKASPEQDQSRRQASQPPQSQPQQHHLQPRQTVQAQQGGEARSQAATKAVMQKADDETGNAAAQAGKALREKMGAASSLFKGAFKSRQRGGEEQQKQAGKPEAPQVAAMPPHARPAHARPPHPGQPMPLAGQPPRPTGPQQPGPQKPGRQPTAPTGPMPVAAPMNRPNYSQQPVRPAHPAQGAPHGASLGTNQPPRPMASPQMQPPQMQPSMQQGARPLPPHPGAGQSPVISRPPMPYPMGSRPQSQSLAPQDQAPQNQAPQNQAPQDQGLPLPPTPAIPGQAKAVLQPPVDGKPPEPAIEKPKEGGEDEYVLSMPNLSGIDSDIAAAIQQAMRNNKK